MEEDIKRYTKVLHHIAMRDLNDIEVEQFFKLLADIVGNMKSVMEYDDD